MLKKFYEDVQSSFSFSRNAVLDSRDKLVNKIFLKTSVEANAAVYTVRFFCIQFDNWQRIPKI